MKPLQAKLKYLFAQKAKLKKVVKNVFISLGHKPCLID